MLVTPRAASAGPLLDFSTLSAGASTDIGPASFLPGGLLAVAFNFNAAGGAWELSTLIGRNEPADQVGLGICSETPSTCLAAGNEASNVNGLEALVLVRPDGIAWSGLWLSALEPEGTLGILAWTDAAATSLNAALFAMPPFQAGDATGQMTLPNGFDPDARFLIFLGGFADNTDYLVWGADVVPTQVVDVPEPATLLLLGTGLLGFAERRRRAKRRQLVIQS